MADAMAARDSRNRSKNRWLLVATLSLLSGIMPQAALAEVLHVPIGTRAVPIGKGRVACEPGSTGFSVEKLGRMIRPPDDPAAIGKPVELRVAASSADCATAEETLTVIATGPLPELDEHSIVFWPDEGRIEAHGAGLEGALIAWSHDKEAGVDACRAPRVDERGQERCAWAVARGASVAPGATSFKWLPKGARPDEDAIFYDGSGRLLPPEARSLVPAKNILSRVLPLEAMVDLSTGQGEVPLLHPEAVGAADCGNLNCQLSGGKLMVRGASRLVRSVDVNLRLVPHVYLEDQENLETQTAARLPVMHCPMTILSGQPIRNNVDAAVAVKLDGRCGNDVSTLRFQSQEGSLKVLQTFHDEGASYALLHLGSFGGDTLTISAIRGTSDGIMVAVAHSATRKAPAVRATLELPDYPNLGFIPNNRPATVHVSPAGEGQYFALLPIEGVYSVVDQGPGEPMLIQADPNAAGLTGLRFGLRDTRVPASFAHSDLAVLSDPLARRTGEANEPINLTPEKSGGLPVIEVLCGGASEKVRHIQLGDAKNLPFSLRDSCRVVFHRERLSKKSGTQKINFEIEVLSADGGSRPQGRVSEQITLRAGETPRYAWISGVGAPFDRVIVRASHVPDEDHYIAADDIRTGAPTAQWAMVFGTGRARLYGTTTIPTGLYRFSRNQDYSGVLSLNFGVISRLTWLDKEGHEGLLGAEAGILVLDLAKSAGNSGESLTQIGAVMGLGMSVPIANRSAVSQASINLHAWFEVNVAGANVEKSRYAVIFGPSISIGNVGVNL